MGDRTWTAVVFHERFYPLAEMEFNAQHGSYVLKGYYSEENKLEIDGAPNLVEIVDDQANYGEMDDIENVLRELKIPYDRSWAPGCEYGGGNWYSRYDEEGENHVLEVYDDSKDKTSIGDLLKLIEGGATIEDVKKRLEQYAKDEVPYGGEQNIANVPIRELTEEEKVRIMKYKLTEEK